MINEQKLNELGKYLKKKHNELRPWAKKNGIECYRIYNCNLPGLPFTLDIYKDCLHTSCFENEDDVSQDDIDAVLSLTGRTLYIKDENIFFKYRKKQTGGSQYNKYDTAAKELIVKENSLSFSVNLSDYLDTGLFLDHRNTRVLVRDNSMNARVLNLFAYTGTFSVYAAAGFAENTTTVDMSNTYLAWAKKNMELNNFTGKNHTYINADALKFIDDAVAAKTTKWDMIILDPPTFSNSRKMDGKFDIQSDHVELIKKCAGLLTKKGMIVFSTNYKKFTLDRAAMRQYRYNDITGETIPLDFSGSKIHKCWLIHNLNINNPRSS
ncbi:MAG: class I SAM-dependent methyltransferase [Spirochaetales bacterium]|nr:class I SAM-dependent methyltransferase [Spirochaetales bacterium]